MQYTKTLLEYVSISLYKAFKSCFIGEPMGTWSKETENIVEFAILAVFGFGIALYLGSTFYTALPSNSIAATAVNNLLTGISTSIQNILVPIIAIIFVLFLYLIVKHSGLLGHNKKE